jgi:putative membrane protein
MMFGSLMMVVFWGAVIVAIVVAVRWLGGGSSYGAGVQPPRKRALDILQERFAHGEIDKHEFDERKRLLSD